MKKSKNTSWEHVAKWYDRLLDAEGTYQKDLILPNLLRLMDIRHGDTVLDLACGQGFFTYSFMEQGAQVIGVDASETLITMARSTTPEGRFYVAKADRLTFVKDKSIDKIAIVLALQNIENIAGVFRECARVLKSGGALYAVLNHPAFRIPKASSWGWDEKEKKQYRRIDKYLSEAKIPIEMHPGDKPNETTLSFHRPLQFYAKALHKNGFSITGLEEWNSHRKSEPGPRAKAEDTARKEIPLFLSLVGAKNKIMY